MSTDYGLKCVTCRSSYIPSDGLGRWAAEMLLRAVEVLPDLYQALQLANEKLDGEVEIKAYFTTYMFELVEFVAKHRNHKFVIVDEYGCEWINGKRQEKTECKS